MPWEFKQAIRIPAFHIKNLTYDYRVYFCP